MSTHKKVRLTDEHDRDLYGPAEQMPEDARPFSIWNGRLVHPNAIVINSKRDHDRLCQPSYGGWMPSGDWWFHCGICRPHRASTP